MNLRVDHSTFGYLLLLLTLLFLHFLQPAPMPSGSVNEGSVFIQVEGDVKCPAVYSFNAPPHLAQLIGRAGGLLYDKVLPQQLEVYTFSSGMKVAVRLREEKSLLPQCEAPRAEASRLTLASGGFVMAKVSEMSAFYKTTLGMPIYLNSVSEMGLTALPGIGLALAKAIVEERIKRGGFKSLDELLSINGIGEKLYRKITPYLTVEGRQRKGIHPSHSPSQV